MKPITLAFLKSLNACQKQVDLFAATHGEEVIPTLATCEAAAQQFDLDWLGRKVFGRAYQAAIEPHWEAYEAARATHWEAYEAAKAPHWEAYEAAKAPLRKALKLAQVRVFFQLWSQQ